MLSFIVPTNNRPQALAQTMHEVGLLDAAALERAGGAEVIVIDNGGDAQPPRTLANGISVTLLKEETNRGAAARNTGAHAAQGDWLVMLDDDSAPIDTGLVDVVLDAPADVAAIGAEIFLPNARHTRGPLAGHPKRESGGVPEVIVGCGALMRRDAFVQCGGYDPSFEYYAEEHDLCAKFLLSGWRVTHDRRFRVNHRKVQAGRDMSRILRLLVRNSGWVAARYTPEEQRGAAVQQVIDRCAHIAENEGVQDGFKLGLTQLKQTIDQQQCTPMSAELHERFVGLAHAREAVANHRQAGKLNGHARLAHPGKNAWCVQQALEEAGVTLLDDACPEPAVAAPAIIATLSPGPALDAVDELAAEGTLFLPSWLWTVAPVLHVNGGENTGRRKVN